MRSRAISTVVAPPVMRPPATQPGAPSMSMATGRLSRPSEASHGAAAAASSSLCCTGRSRRIPGITSCRVAIDAGSPLAKRSAIASSDVTMRAAGHTWAEVAPTAQRMTSGSWSTAAPAPSSSSPCRSLSSRCAHPASERSGQVSATGCSPHNQPETRRLGTCQRITQPPSTVIDWPVMKSASREARNATSPATSAGSPRRLIACRSMSIRSSASVSP